MDSNLIMNLGVSFLSYLAFASAMIAVLLVAVCFLGRDIRITGKTILGAAGIILLSIAYLTWYMTNEDKITEIAKQFLGTEDEQSLSLLSSFAMNAICFAYAFVFYLIVYKEKKLIRAIEAAICLYGFYYYLNNISEMSILYLLGGTDDAMKMMLDSLIYGDSRGISLVVVLFDLLVSVLLSLFLYFMMYRKKTVHIISIRNRVLFIIWIIVFSAVHHKIEE